MAVGDGIEEDVVRDDVRRRVGEFHRVLSGLRIRLVMKSKTVLVGI